MGAGIAPGETVPVPDSSGDRHWCRSRRPTNDACPMFRLAPIRQITGACPRCGLDRPLVGPTEIACEREGKTDLTVSSDWRYSFRVVFAGRNNADWFGPLVLDTPRAIGGLTQPAGQQGPPNHQLYRQDTTP